MSNLLQRMAKLATVKPSHLIYPDHYRITVKSDKTPTAEEIRSAYDRVNGDWLDPPPSWRPEYTVFLHESLRNRKPPIGEVIVRTVRFVGDMKDKDVVEWTKSNGCRLLFPHERERFAQAEPDLQRWQELVDLGTYRFSGVHSKPVLTSSDFARVLNSSCSGCSFRESHWWAGTVFLVALDENR